jgi:hypothetical protein
LTNLDDQIRRFPKGPQFSLKGAIPLFFISIALLIISISGIFQSEFLLSSVTFILFAILIILVIDIRGIEIDLRENRIRDYKSLYEIKIGKWENLNIYKSIIITKGVLKIPTTEYSDHSYDPYFYYYVKLIDENKEKELTLAEFNELSKALEFLRTSSFLLKAKDITVLQNQLLPTGRYMQLSSAPRELPG